MSFSIAVQVVQHPVDGMVRNFGIRPAGVFLNDHKGFVPLRIEFDFHAVALATLLSDGSDICEFGIPVGHAIKVQVRECFRMPLDACICFFPNFDYEPKTF